MLSALILETLYGLYDGHNPDMDLDNWLEYLGLTLDYQLPLF